MMQPSLIERITRSLAYMLRHRPDEFDLELDSHGYADLEDVVHALNERLGDAIEAEDVLDAVESGDRERYEVRDGRIRALYGHSIDVDPGSPSKPPEVLYLGVAAPDAERALRFGLRGGRRRFLHLALTPESAVESGRRMARDYTILEIRSLEAWEEGINFYDRRSLYLADPIPTEFIDILEEHHDGEPPQARSARPEGALPAGGRSGREERGRGRDRDRGPGWDRERGREGSRRGEGRREELVPAAREGRAGHRERPERVPERRESGVPPRVELERPVRERERERDRDRGAAPSAGRSESREPRAVPQAPPANSGGGFGLGIFEEAPQRPQRAHAPEPRERSAPERAPEPAPEPSPERPERSGESAFGAGVL